MRQKIRIGELLVKNRILTSEQLETALEQQKKHGKRLGQLLLELGYVEEDEFLTFLAEQLQIPFIDLGQRDIDRETVMKLPQTHARRFRAILLEDTGKDYLVGMADPMDLLAVDEISRIVKKPIRQAQKISRPVETIDIAPTLSLLVGAKPPSGSTGSPLLEVLHP